MNTTVTTQGNISAATKFVYPTGAQGWNSTVMCRDLCSSTETTEENNPSNEPGEVTPKDDDTQNTTPTTPENGNNENNTTEPGN